MCATHALVVEELVDLARECEAARQDVRTEHDGCAGRCAISVAEPLRSGRSRGCDSAAI